jgi:hypothetical protein
MAGEPTDPVDEIVILAPGQAAFDAALAGVTFVDDGDRAALPYAVVIQNHGPHTIVAYCLQWVFDDGDGSPLVTPQLYSQPFGLDDGDRRGLMFEGGIALGPGGSRLITPAENYDLKLAAAEGIPSYPGKAEVAQQRLRRFLENTAKKPFAEVRLAATVLRDGSYFERHPCSLRDSLQASVDGMQDVFQAADQIVFEGDIPDFVARVDAATNREISKGADYFRYDAEYRMSRDLWLRSITYMMERGGYDSTMEYLGDRLYAHRPSIGGR